MPTTSLVTKKLRAELKPVGAKHRWWKRRMTRRYIIHINRASGIDHTQTSTYAKKQHQINKKARARGPHGTQGGPLPVFALAE